MNDENLRPRDGTAPVSRLAERPAGRADVVLDTDAYNEIDDLYAIAYLLSSEERLNVRGIFAAPFYSPSRLGRTRQNQSPKEGMLASFDAIMELLEVMKRSELTGLVSRGAPRLLPDEATPVDAPAVDELIRLARLHSPENPLYVVGIAVLTDIASALLKAPDISGSIVIVWLGGHSRESGSCRDFNAIQDIAAARVVFDSGAPIVQLPCEGVVSEFRVNRDELDKNLRSDEPLGEYLKERTFEFMREKTGSDQWEKPLWDVTAVAWLLDPAFMDDRVETRPVFGYDGSCTFPGDRQMMRYVYRIHTQTLLTDLYRRLSAVR